MGDTEQIERRAPAWQLVLFAALAGGMGWGIRGQYGHETGAMIAGVLVSLVIVLLLCPRSSSLAAARAVAFGTIAMGFGGTETYGQTIGLTQNPIVVGNWEAFRWGMLGLAIKGGLWIGFAGTFLGMGLGGLRYRAGEILLLMLGALGMYQIGVLILNSPFDPANRLLPEIYFSASWYWEPDATNLEPRYEAWGGLWFALLFVMGYAALQRKDGMAWRLGLWGVVGGAIGFPAGQCIQSYHAWNPESFTQGIWEGVPFNWWNMMETTFGLILGAVLGFGAWLHQARVRPAEVTNDPGLFLPLEWLVIGVHCTFLVMTELVIVPVVERTYDLGLIMGIIPLVAVAAGRWSPYLIIFPVTLLPIAGKTLRNLVYGGDAVSVAPGWLMFMLIPMILAVVVAGLFALRAERQANARRFLALSLMFCTWIYFLLNFAFFRFPWPWLEWTGRTPNAIIFTVCALGLSGLAVAVGRRVDLPVVRE